MSYNYPRRAQGPWRDRYYPYDASYSHQQAYQEPSYGYDYDNRHYDGPSSSQGGRYYLYDDYRYPTNERQVGEYGYDGYARYAGFDSDQHRSTHKRRHHGHRTIRRDNGAANDHVPVPYTYAQDDRPVTPPPPRSPSPTYIKLAEEPPQRLPRDQQDHKLLILDLNGTLVHRAAHTRAKNRNAADALDNNGRPLPRLRPVHPRPYMTAFRSYLFAPETRAWLDVMIWSSAQPHSVGDMVDKCFASDKEKLLAIWARDTLGLPQEHYYRKVQTVKDLDIPWSKLSSTNYDSDASSSNGSPTPKTSIHSALTTLLLDDSPRKAELQPYNHFCVPEYSGEMRAKDLEVLRLEQLIAESHSTEANHDLKESVDPAAEATADSEVEAIGGNGGGDGDVDTTRKRKRKEKKEAKRLQAVLAATDERQAKTYDETLLAVIGVLDEIKSQRNVAAWIRAGGLWGSSGNPAISEDDFSDSDHAKVEHPPSSSDSSSPLRPRKGIAEAAPDSVDADKAWDGTSEVHGRRARSKERKRQQREAAAERGKAIESSPPAGNDAVSATEPRIAEERGDGLGVMTSATSVWFEHPPTLQFWVERGKKVLQELHIPVDHGIRR